MTFGIALLLAIILIALVFFSSDWLPADVVALGLLLALVVTGLIPSQKAFAGFGSDTVIMIFSLLIMTTALAKVGVVDLVGRNVLRYTGSKSEWLLLGIMVTVAMLSAFMSNTAATALFVPIGIGVAKRAKTSAKQFLLPIAFASILSSSVTLISTSTNIVVSGLMVTSGLPPMGMFELAPVGIPICLTGLLYMFLIGRRLFQTHEPSEELIESFGVRPYLTELMILPSSPWVGKTLAESGLGSALDLTVLKIVRNKTEEIWPNNGSALLQANDILLVEGAKEEVLKIKDIQGIEIKADVKLSDPNLQNADTTLVEVILLPASPLIGRTLKKFRFRERYGLQVLAMNRLGKNVLRKLSQIRLRMGDVLLLQGRKSSMAALHEDPAFRVLGAVTEPRLDRRKALMAVAIFVGCLTLGILRVLPLPTAFLLGAFLTFIARCITPEDAYRELDWKVVILIACMLSLGEAMNATGADNYLAGLVVKTAGGLGPLWLLGGYFLLTVALTQPMSNQAAAAVILPVAIETATQLGLNPRTFAMMVAVAASCSYLTPLEPSCLMVYGPGRYRFSDFLKVGGGLTVVIFVIAIVLVPRVWPMR